MPVEAAVSFILEHPEWGWVVALGFGFWQLFAPWETRLDRLVSRVEDRIESIEKSQKAHMTVTRAIARTNDEIDNDAVDQYLAANGAEPEDFIFEAHKERYERWQAENPEGGGFDGAD